MTFTLQRYHVSAQLYDGPNSQVYRARRRDDDLPVILKVLKPALVSAERLERFRHEYETLRGLSLPSVVKAYGLENDEHRWILVQEDMGGDSLEQHLTRRRFSLAEQLDLALRITDALGQLHQKHIIHKDINPANIVWNPETGRLALIDLGIATSLSREHPTLRPAERLEGTLAYIAPEQTGRMNRDIDYRTDFYSLGVTLYRLFTGECPFIATEPMEFVHCHIARKPLEPHKRTPEVPKAVSGIILKLMAKMAEARYQSSYGIKADLATCLEQLRSTGAVGEFELGRSDVPERFQIPQKLYGREREVDMLLTSFERVAESSGRVDLVLVNGYSGIGKSSLVHELHGSITGRRGYFASGKFDQLQRGTPYTAVTSAFRSLVRHLLGERESQLSEWRKRLLTALGPNARVVIDVVPELELIVGPQPPVPALGATEAQNRFNLVFLSFLRVFAQKAHPLVLFLDDLQWSDSASLKLLELMVTDDQPGHLLLIGAYRDNEVDPAHPLMMSIGRLQQAGASIQEFHVPPLPLEHVGRFIADILYADTTSVAPLAELVLHKTAGNPFFVTQLLKEVHTDGLITLDHQQGRWRWDMERIQARSITNNVVDLMIGKLRRKPEATQESLRLAACLGNRFSLETLAIIRDRPLSEVYTTLLPAISDGVVLPSSEPELALPGTPGAPLAAHEYQFLHDRVQQAAYSLMGALERKHIHLRAGRLLLLHIPAEKRTERIFEIVDQLNHGRSLIDDPKELAELAQLNLTAGLKAKAAAAYAAAREHLAIGARVLPAGSWTSNYEFTSHLYRELAEAECLVGNYVQADEVTKELLEQARTPVEKAEVHNLVVDQRTMLGRYEDAIEETRKGLALLGIDLPRPKEDLERIIAQESTAIRDWLGDRPIDSLIDIPLVTDLRARAAVGLLTSALPASFYVFPLGYGFAVLKTVRMSLEFGLSPQSANLFSFYAHHLAIQGQYQLGYAFGELSVQLSKKFKSPINICRSYFLLANFVLPWVKPLRQSKSLSEAGYQIGVESGEFLFTGYMLFYMLLHPFYEGVPLKQTLAEVPAFLQFALRAKNQLATDFMLAFRRAVGILTNAPPEETSEEEYLQSCERNQSTMAICFYFILKTQALYLLGKPEEGLQAASAAERVITAIAGNIAVAQHTFYTTLCLVALLPKMSPEERARHMDRLRDNQAKLARWAKGCPENFAHLHALACAEIARIEGRQQEASERYEQAIQAARRHGFAQDEALANELAGKFWIAWGKHRAGLSYLAEALHGYWQWGTHRKAAALAAEFPELTVRANALHATFTQMQSASVLDLSSVLKASNAISSEIVLDKLLARMMDIVIENAGAERGILLLDRDGELCVHVEASAQHNDARQATIVQKFEPRPISQYEAIAENIVVYVQRTREIVLLGDASREGPFTQTPYVLQRKPRSLLAMPLVGQGKLIGILYLENNFTAGAFTPARLEMLKLLSSQMGISLENAILYSEMEHRVRARTTELQQKNEQLQNTQQQLIHAEKMASLGQLAAGVAHELRNPLNFIKNFAEDNVELTAELSEAVAKGLAARATDLRDELLSLKQSSEKILEHSERAEGIIRSMVHHAGSTSSERRRVDLNTLLEQYVSLAHLGMRAQQQQARSQRPEANILIERDYDSTLVDVELNPQELGRVIVNLMNNAFHAVLERQRKSSEGFTPTVAISTRHLGNMVVIRVRDNGIGIPAALHEKIFEPFFTTKPPGMGTGLGLSLCYDVVVKGHRGKLDVQSQENQGAEFMITLPA